MGDSEKQRLLIEVDKHSEPGLDSSPAFRPSSASSLPDAQPHKHEIQGIFNLTPPLVTAISSASLVTIPTVMVSSSQGGQMVLSSQGGTIVSSQGGQGQMVLSSQGGTIVSSRVGGGAVMVNSQGQQVGQLVNTSGGQLVSQGHQLVNTGAGQLVSGGQLVQSSGGQLFLKAGQSVVSQPPAAGQAMLLTQGSGQQKTIIMQAQNKQSVATTGANQVVQVSPGGRDQLVQLCGQLVQVAGQPTQQLAQVQGQQTQQFMEVSGQQLVQPQLVQVQGQQMVQVLPGQQQGHVVQVQPGAGQQVLQLMQVQGQPLVPGQQIVQVGGKQGAVLQAQNPVIQQVVISQGLTNGTQPLVKGNKASPPPSVSPSPTVTSCSPSPPPPIKINPSALFVCEWASCLKAFKTPKEVEYHAISEHCPLVSDDIPCLWQRCDGMKRKRFSLITHLHERHCHPQLMAVRRVQISQSGKSDVPLPPAPPPHPGYAPNAALHAIKRHAVEFVNPKEIALWMDLYSLVLLVAAQSR